MQKIRLELVEFICRLNNNEIMGNLVEES